MRKHFGIVTFLLASLLCLNPAFVQNSWALGGSYLTSKDKELVSGQESAEYYCAKANESETPEREANLLLCANAYLKIHKNFEAKALLNGLKNYQFQGNLQSFRVMVDGRYAYNIGNLPRALSLLTRLKPEAMSLPVAIEYHDLLARVYQANGDHLKSLDQRISLDALLSDKDLAALNNHEIWATLDLINIRTLQGAAQETKNTLLKGWLKLAIIERQMVQGDSNTLEALTQWRQDFRNHPGEDLLPNNLSSQALENFRPARVALLLPLTGPLSSSAQAIRDGFLASAYWQARHSHHTPQITVIDTHNDQDVASAYETAVSQGAEMIVGPLTKSGVLEMMRVSSGNIPVLALNNVDERGPSNFYLFGLSPEDEARQAAHQAFLDGHRNALILAQTGEWGERLARSFQTEWENLGGKLIHTTYLSSQELLSPQVKSSLGIDSSEERAKILKSELDHPIEFDARRRQDLDMIFVAAQTRDARQLPPLLAFYYAHDLPIYATSSIYSGVPNPKADKDLNGVIFCDITWNTDQTPDENSDNTATSALWPSTDQPSPRLYGLGVDAYQLIGLLPRLENFPQFAYNGATGQLSMNQNRTIDRGLHCTKFVDGEPKRIKSSV